MKRRYQRFASRRTVAFLDRRRASLSFPMISTIPCLKRSKMSSISDEFPVNLEAHLVIRRRSVGRWHRLFIQAQIQTELGTVVYQVIEKHLAVGEKARSAEDRLLAENQLPGLSPGCVWSVLERGASLRCTLVESLNQLRRRVKRHGRELGFREIKFRCGKDHQTKARQLRHVRSKLIQRHGFGMGRKVFLVFRNSLQHRARLLDFFIEFGQ